MMMNGHLIRDTRVPGFGLGRLDGSCSSSEEQLYSCSPGSDSSVYYDALPYLDFHLPERKLGSRDCSPECLRKGYHVSLVSSKPVRTVATENLIAERYIARAAQLVAGLQLDDPLQNNIKKTDKLNNDESNRKEIQSSNIKMATQNFENGVENDCEEFILFYDENDKIESNNMDEVDRQINQEKRESKLRRASSLKSPKSPPSPGEKKIVRFADALGLDLADVRTFLDEIPKIPRSAYKDLEGVEISPSPVGSFTDSYMGSIRNEKSVVPLFDQPFSSKDFMTRLQQNSICLESASITDPNLFMITGVVRVINLGFHKEVLIRYSDDSWATHNDLKGRYLPNSCDGFSDKFSFVLFANGLEIGKRLELALCYKVNETEFWDNNNNANYTFQCIPVGIPRPVSTYEPSPLTFGSSFSGSFF